jgi:hypothetical protein
MYCLTFVIDESQKYLNPAVAGLRFASHLQQAQH